MNIDDFSELGNMPLVQNSNFTSSQNSKSAFPGSHSGYAVNDIHPRSIGQHARKRRWVYLKPHSTPAPHFPVQGVFSFMNEI